MTKSECRPPPTPSRVVLCTSGGLFGSLVMNRLLRSNRLHVVGVIESSRVLRADYSWLRGAGEQIRISGFRYSVYLWAATSLSDAFGRVSGHGSVAAEARRLGIPRLVTRDINGQAGHDFLQDVAPDLLVSGFFNQRLTAAVFTIPTAGAVNIHPSLLPNYRGVDPVFFARLRQERRLGVTVHRIDSDLDTGNVLYAHTVPVTPEHSVLHETASLFRRGAELIAENIDTIASGAAGHPQDRAGNYDSWPTVAEVGALRRQGTALLRFRDLAAIASGRWAQG